MMPPVVVFDCNTFLQGMLNVHGPAGACLQLFRAGDIVLSLSPEVLVEVRDVLHRPELRRKFRQLSPERVERLLDYLASTARLTSNVLRHVELARDPKVEPYLNLAITVGARYLVTRD